MSHHSDDQLLQAGSDSFWELNNYKRTTKRIEDGYKLCTELQTLIQERAEIEKAYAKNLKAWSKKWGELIEKGPEYGTTEAAWKGMLTEAERLSDLHLKIKANLCTDVTLQIKEWQKDNYHKSMMQIKERKEMEDQFKRAQKPWAKLLASAEKAKADYHAACKMEKSATNQERNASSDSSMSNDQLKKMQERVQKLKDDVAKSRDRYEQTLSEIKEYNPVYIESMTNVFRKCQEMEETRLCFFKNVLFSIHKCLNISEDPSLPQIYKEFHHTINNADHQKDLKWWSNNHGVNMGMSWPTFVEYTEEFRDIAKGIKSKEALPAAPITLIHQRPVAEDVHEYPPPPPANNNRLLGGGNRNSTALSISNSTSNNRTTTPTPNNDSPKSETASTKNEVATTPTRNSPARAAPGGAVVTNGNSGTNGKANDSNPFEEEEEWDEGDGHDNLLVDNGEPGVPVKALYDYEGAESDELTFKQGDLFEKLEDEDEQGWCKGRKDGRVGLYPANYVEVVAT
ncbi:protein kinase C and casein kinase II substrate protein 3 isoform X1 [Anopheles arabiensis]|uniref:Protein kinase C and casein kinase substrate in neurons 2 protein n=6 Tax=gambiae species complex TaxID=44542 RepID=A0A1S4GX35_ANOGA|nr:protein kinase C and casein kinase II substrate protein 3 isoform X1 [Anopheles arabiensis]XP_040230718.1 protein kinase C and casein kinase II substrate protein 3 isoform X1 [Anopheles coluzzii]XP_061510412.1 protein kinase C and casein kinase II substrate protein 3 isoform X1 [Anopheles gambiae]XP_061510413.1 protein kinase C and casein kinase II substrate protein 3 isoform X1 [Anopheles gambiae]XP_061510414.1 protein kinase C and casein kinase II substrate protein 3 isoform X1 [Anopheles 